MTEERKVKEVIAALSGGPPCHHIWCNFSDFRPISKCKTCQEAWIEHPEDWEVHPFDYRAFEEITNTDGMKLE